MRLLDDDAIHKLKDQHHQQLKKFEFGGEDGSARIDPEVLLSHSVQMQYEMKTDLYKLFELQDHYLQGSVHHRHKVQRGISEFIHNICKEQEYLSERFQIFHWLLMADRAQIASVNINRIKLVLLRIQMWEQNKLINDKFE
jgi:hypothetical protein